MVTSHFWGLMLLSSFLAITYGYTLDEARVKRQVPDVCKKPPMKRLAHMCCRLPKERVWGDLRDSLTKCVNQMKQEEAPARQELGDDGEATATMTPEGSDEGPGVEASSAPSVPPFPSTHRPFGHRRHGPHHKRRPYHFRLRAKDECFMECVFEDQGFLLNKKANKEALLDRINITLGNNNRWYNAAKAAVETCHQMQEEAAPSNKTCQSGSEEIFRCVFKQIFFNCPTWPQNNEYCASLRDFYQRCPDGPPPELDDNHSMPLPPSPPPAEDNTDETPTTESSEE